MKRTTSVLLTGALAAGAALSLSVAVPGIASASGCGATAVNTQADYDKLFSQDPNNDTRSHGHHVLEAGYLHVYTDGNSDTEPSGASTQNADKVTGYYTIGGGGVALADQTADSNYVLSYNTLSGTIPPGYQLAVDLDGNGTQDGILVHEPQFYGSEWWLTNGSSSQDKADAPHTGGGYGSQYYGTLDEWSVKFPSAKITAFGYSLGSGVQGDYAVSSITFGCNSFTFDLHNASPTASFTQSTSATDYRAVSFDASNSSDPEDGSNLRYTWNFGDGQTAAGVTQQHTYAKGKGDYTVTLTVTDSHGATGTTQQTVHIVPPSSTVASGGLPNTGANVIGLSAIGGLVLVGGGSGLVLTRRRKVGAHTA